MPGNGLRRYRWLESGLLPLAAAVMRASWLTPLIHLIYALPIVSPPEEPYPGWLVLALLLGASALAGAAGPRPVGRVVVAAAGLVTVALAVGGLFGFDPSAPSAWLRRQCEALTDLRVSLPAQLVTIAVTATLWYRGVTIDWADSATLWRSFLLGVIVLGGILLLDLGSLAGMAGVDLRASTLSLLVSGMLAMALISAAEMLSLQRARGRAAPFLNRYWLVTAGSVVLAILIAGWLLTQIVSPRAAADALRAVGGLIGALLDLLSVVIVWIAYVAMWILWPLIMALRDVLVEGSLVIPEEGGGRESPFAEMPTELRALEPGVQGILRIAAAAAVVAGLALAFYLAERRRRRQQTEVAERRESILSVGLLRAQWEEWRRRRRRGVGARYLSLEGEEDARRAVRAVYQRLLARAEAMGLPRSPGETAIAHSRNLERNLPAIGAELRAVTEVYQVARYAARPPGPDEVAAVRRAWARLERLLEERAATPRS